MASTFPSKRGFGQWTIWGAVSTVSVLSACGGDGGVAFQQPSCDTASIRAALGTSADTDVLLAQAFSKDALLKLPNSPVADAGALKAASDMCVVKLLVKGGNTSEPTSEPSYTQGVGIEVYLPTTANWNERIRTYGSGGFMGGYHTDITRLGQNAGQGDQKLNQAVGKGFVVSHSDGGHSGAQGGVGGTGVANAGGGEGEWAMKADGTPNTEPWKDYSERSMHVTAIKTKEVVKAFYGKQQKFAYFDGFSTGGRQAWKIAQRYPDDYDGILAGAPAFNFPKFVMASVFPQTVMQQDLGRPITPAKLNAVSSRSVAACDTLNIGVLLDPLSCQYDPAKDKAAICATSTLSDGMTAGSNSDSGTCVTLAEAKAINKIWYGQTRDGRNIDPSSDLGNGKTTNSSSQQMWFGVPRGSLLAGNFPTLLMANSSSTGTALPLTIATDFLALTLDNPSLASTNFYNKTGNGIDGWKSVGYGKLAEAADLAMAMEGTRFGNVATDSTDLSGFRNSGRKILHYHGLADTAIFPQGSINYYERAMAAMGGISELQKFARFYLIPGLAHTSSFNFSGQHDKADPTKQVNANLVPLPQGSNNPVNQATPGRDEMFNALMTWVEQGTAPGSIEVASLDGSVKMPLCVYPTKITAKQGTADLKAATSYECK